VATCSARAESSHYAIQARFQLGIPNAISSQANVIPLGRREMLDVFVGDVHTLSPQILDNVPQMDGIPGDFRSRQPSSIMIFR
jgi:hypothetical protein